MKRRERKTLRLSLFLVLASVATAMGVTAYVDSVRLPQYQSIARLLITPNADFSDGRNMLVSLETLGRTTIQATYEEVLNSSRIQEAARSSVLFMEGEPSDFVVETVALPSADVLQITAQGPSGPEAAALANEVMRHGIPYLENQYPMYTLQILDEAVVPVQPFAPNLPRDLILASVVGAAFGLALALVISRAILVRLYEREVLASPKPRQIKPRDASDLWLSSKHDMEPKS